MHNEITCDIHYSYPGRYVPLLKEEHIDEELRHFHEGDMFLPPANIEELADTFRIEIAMPGLKREDFLIHIDSNVLFIRVLRKEARLKKRSDFKLHEFNYACFERRITLPPNADAEFMSAEYKNGMLQVMIPKATQPVTNPHSRIVVY
ncbi:Hsp20/alpha crystallin family protein [Terrimonas alba]|uniref:Hsp20/alpha crystallin family protein n=1 Tax=Terrimonas alba TaxID=3349636 RepID=UPI0035F476A0